MSTIGETLTKLEQDTFLGRDRELATFQSWLHSGPSTILNVHGPGGVGKSTLLRAFRRAADQQGRPTLLIDGRHFRASAEGFLGARA